jgi:hypothetical protein
MFRHTAVAWSQYLELQIYIEPLAVDISEDVSFGIEVVLFFPHEVDFLNPPFGLVRYRCSFFPSCLAPHIGTYKYLFCILINSLYKQIFLFMRTPAQNIAGKSFTIYTLMRGF